MKNKNGFTLIELLVTITIILILTVSGFVTFHKITEKQKQREYNEYGIRVILQNLEKEFVISNTPSTGLSSNNYSTVNVSPQDGYIYLNRGFLKNNTKIPAAIEQDTDRYIIEADDSLGIQYVWNSSVGIMTNKEDTSNPEFIVYSNETSAINSIVLMVSESIQN